MAFSSTWGCCVSSTWGCCDAANMSILVMVGLIRRTDGAPISCVWSKNTPVVLDFDSFAEASAAAQALGSLLGAEPWKWTDEDRAGNLR